MWQHALQGKKEESVHTHQHIGRAVKRMLEEEQERRQGSTYVDYPLTATVYILYCSISYTCHTCCLCECQTLSTRCTHKQMMFCNCLYLKLFFQWLYLNVDAFHRCNIESLMCCCRAFFFFELQKNYRTHAVGEVFMVCLKLYDQHSQRCIL